MAAPTRVTNGAMTVDIDGQTQTITSKKGRFTVKHVSYQFVSIPNFGYCDNID